MEIRRVRRLSTTNPAQKWARFLADRFRSRLPFSDPCLAAQFHRILACLTPPFAKEITMLSAMEVAQCHCRNDLPILGGDSAALGHRAR